MTSWRHLLAVAGLFTATQIGCVADAEEELGASADAITNGRIVIKGFGSPGPKLAKWGYDIKQPGRARDLKPALAKELFGDIGMNLLRVAVWAVDGHPSAGNVSDKTYEDDLAAIENVRSVRDVEIFASLKLVTGKPSFPAWVKDGGEVSAGKYARLLEDFLAYMKKNGVTIDWLGVDNERKYNEGNITPAKYNAIVADVKSWCRNHDVKVPSFVAPDDYGPVEDAPWLSNLWQTNAKFDHVDAVGVHTYSKHRKAPYIDALERLADVTHGKRLWDTELHWNDRDEDGDVKFDDIKAGMLLAMDHFDLGFQSLTWWAFQPRSRGTKASHIMSELVKTTVGASTLPTDDMDGKAPAAGKLNSRAFKTGAKQVVLWVASFDGKDRKDQWAQVLNEEVVSASYVQWSSTSAASGKSGNASVVAKNRSCFAMNYPSNTITRVLVNLK